MDKRAAIIPPKRGDAQVPRIHKMYSQTEARRGRQRKHSHFPHDVMFTKRSLGRGKELEVDLLWKGRYKYMTNARAWVYKCMMWRKSMELLVRFASMEKALGHWGGHSATSTTWVPEARRGSIPNL